MGAEKFSEACAQEDGPPVCIHCGGEDFTVLTQWGKKLTVAAGGAGVGYGLGVPVAIVLFAPGAIALAVGGVALGAAQLVGKRIQCRTCLVKYKPG